MSHIFWPNSAHNKKIEESRPQLKSTFLFDAPFGQIMKAVIDRKFYALFQEMTILGGPKLPQINLIP